MVDQVTNSYVNIRKKRGEVGGGGRVGGYWWLDERYKFLPPKIGLRVLLGTYLESLK